VKFSLVQPTCGRTTELTRFLLHLDQQTYRNFELIVVDQNPDGFLKPVLEPYLNRFPIIHVLSESKGLSHNRNVGLGYVTGQIVVFPDDDCWYPSDILDGIAGCFRDHPEYQGVTCRCIDDKGRDAFNRFDTTGGEVTKYNIWARSNSNCIFVTRDFAIRSRFNESLGKGTASDTAAEEMDFLLRGMNLGLRVIYTPKLFVHHRLKVRTYSEPAIIEARCHATGQGQVLRRYNYRFPYVLYLWMRPLAGVLVAVATLNPRRLRYHLAMTRGRVEGWIAQP